MEAIALSCLIFFSRRDAEAQRETQREIIGYYRQKQGYKDNIL
jgi:hypothetical protein